MRTRILHPFVLRLCSAMGVALLVGGMAANAQNTPPAPPLAPPPVAAATSPAATQVMDVAVAAAVAAIKPSLVRIQVVSTDYSDGREVKYQSSGSGVIISKEGHIVTNHHVAGHATRLMCTLSTKEEIEAELVGRDPLTDIAVIKLKAGAAPREFPVAKFGDSACVRVGQPVLAMGSPLALSQSVTSGIISNTELTMPEWMGSWGRVTQDGEDVGALVLWLGHDARIFPGNSGGPLVSLDGEIIGINEIQVGLGGAIPGNVAKTVAEELVAKGSIRRSWLGFAIQPRLKHAEQQRGVLLSGVIKGSPADAAGVQAGDLLVSLAGQDIDIRFPEQLPALNKTVAALTIGQPVELTLLRDGKETKVTATPIEREEMAPPESELKQWGLTASNISFVKSKEMKRDNKDGVLITSVRPGGPTGDTKPKIVGKDVIVDVDGTPVKNVQELRDLTKKITEGQKKPVPVLLGYERNAQRLVAVVKVGITELEDPGQEVQKAWLPVETQVLTRDIAVQIKHPELTGFRVTQVYPNSTAERAGIRLGDYVLSVDGQRLMAGSPEDYEELPTLIRQYKIKSVVELAVLRGNDQLKLSVELAPSPKLPREMKKFKDEHFEMTVRDIAFVDVAREKWTEGQQGVLAEEVREGGWAAVGKVNVGDLIIAIDGRKIRDVADYSTLTAEISANKPKTVVVCVLRDIYTLFLEIEPKWDNNR